MLFFCGDCNLDIFFSVTNDISFIPTVINCILQTLFVDAHSLSMLLWIQFNLGHYEIANIKITFM